VRAIHPSAGSRRYTRMNRSKAFTVVSVPVAVGLVWRRHRQTVQAVNTHPSVAPQLPGECREIATSWGTIAYRWREGDPDRPGMVLVHGWGRTADSTWWPLIATSERTLAVLDLPGHGRSKLDQPFTFELAAEAVNRVIEHSGLVRPVLVAHSMGGPVVLTALRGSDPGRFSGLVAMATSVYWGRPRLRAILAVAPYLLANGSPVLIHREHAELRHAPDLASHIAWAYTQRPLHHRLREAAAALRRFDARGWTDLELPHTTWVVAGRDRVLAPGHQRASARHCGADVVELDVEHSMVVPAQRDLFEILDTVGCSPAEARVSP
jgi:pimeloyl-ACP methyl ester carboxylesterase